MKDFPEGPAVTENGSSVKEPQSDSGCSQGHVRSEGFPVAVLPRNTYSALVTALKSFTAWFLLHVWSDLCGPYLSYVSSVTYLHFSWSYISIFLSPLFLKRQI